MRSNLSLLWTDPALRVVVLVLVLTGALISSLAPYMSLIAIARLGFSDQAYALILIAASIVSLVSAIGSGIVTDQHPLRRQTALLAAGLLVIGMALMWLWPSKLSFVLAHAILMPSGFTLFVLVLALSSLAIQPYPSARDFLLAAVRATFALPFVVVLPLWAVALRAGMDVMAIYPIALLLALALALLIWFRWPPDDAKGWTDAKSGLNLRQSLAEITDLRVLSRVLLLGGIAAGGALYIVLVGLVFDQTPGRSDGDAALYVGLVAGLEVPFMLLVPQLLHRFAKVPLIAVGAALYCIHLVLLPLIAASPLVWALMLPAAAGGAIILTLPIAYLQDLLAARPGAGSSLLSLQRVAGDTMCAGAFALGTWASGYALAAVLGALLMLAGGIGLMLADHQRRR